MKYRAAVKQSGLERPIECYGNHLSELSKWAKAYLAMNPGVTIEVYETVEVAVTVWKSDEEKPDLSPASAK